MLTKRNTGSKEGIRSPCWQFPTWQTFTRASNFSFSFDIEIQSDSDLMYFSVNHSMVQRIQEHKDNSNYSHWSWHVLSTDINYVTVDWCWAYVKVVVLCTWWCDTRPTTSPGSTNVRVWYWLDGSHMINKIMLTRWNQIRLDRKVYPWNVLTLDY